MKDNAKPGVIAIIGPGLLVAATGVGVGDLATASFAGSFLGTAILWAVLAGAFFKFVVTEGLARWQLATGDTLLEGVIEKFGRMIGWLFICYLILWSFFVASAAMSGMGVTLHAMIPLFGDAVQGKIVFGILSSLIGLSLVLSGGYQLFDKVMRWCIGVMFFAVILTAVLLWPGTGEVLRGLFVPTIPDFDGLGLTWTVALVGGVGGTVTVLCYGYWIREEGRTGSEHLRTCRIDLTVAYSLTAVFGIAMVIIGSNIEIEGSSANLLVNLGAALEQPLGPLGKWLFLVGAAAAVFSSLLGMWQAVPYLFADTWRLVRHTPGTQERSSESAVIDTKSLPYRGYLFALALIPMLGLFWHFHEIQKFYAIIGASFIPFLAVALLILNGSEKWVGTPFKNRPATVLALIAILAFFAWIAWTKVTA